ncbi:BamA/TamA family outer membrane protein [Nibrella viscosa]
MKTCLLGCLLSLLVDSMCQADQADTIQRRAYRLVESISITGNKRTKDFIIRREMDVQPGDTLWLASLNERLQANARRIFNTQLFVSAQVQVDTAQRTSADTTTLALQVVVKENWYIWAAPYARLNDRNLNEWIDRGSDFRRLNYGAFIDHENLFGRMQKLEFVFETGFTDRFTLNYNVPYLTKGRNLGLFSQLRYQTLANVAYNTIGNQLNFIYEDAALLRQFEGRLKLRRRQGFYSFHYADLGYQQTTISESLRELNPFYLQPEQTTQRFMTLGYTYRYDRRDNINFALKGRTFIADLRRMGLLPTDDFESWQFRLAYADYYPLGRNWFGNYMLKAKAFTNPDVPYNLLRGIGYEEDVLRGYDLYVVNGSAYVSGRANIKRELFRRTFPLGFIKWRQFNTLPLNLYLTAFTDWGYVYNRYPDRLSNSLTNRWLRSAGIGLEINTWYNAVVRFNLSRNTLGQTNFFINLQKDIWTRWN